MAEIILYGIIGDSFDKLDARTVTEQIRASTGPLAVRINSPGGYVMEGLAIVQALRDYPSKVTIYIDGLAASMASVIAMVGAEIIMAESALMMVHKPWDSSIGNADDLRRDAAKLDRIEEQLIGIYAKRTGLPAARLATMLADETWMTPDEALAFGFVTSIAAPLQIAACAVRLAYGFRNTPATLRENHVPLPTPTPTPSPSDPVAIERGRVSGILAMAKHGISHEALNTMIQNGISIEAAREAVLNYLADQSDAANISHVFMPGGNQTLDNPQVYGAAVRDALVAKISGIPATGPAAEYQGMTVTDIARDYLSRLGVRDVLRMNPDRIINAAMSGSSKARANGWGLGSNVAGTHTTSDFPDLIGDAAEKYMIDRYKLQQSQLKKLARRRDHNDFLVHYGVQMGSWGALDTVNEAGEYKNRSVQTRKEGYRIQTFGNMFTVSRQMLVNDGMGALADILQVMAAGAAETEAALLAAIINSNLVLSDGTAWFHANHGNLASPGAALTIASLDQGRLTMRSQKDIGGTGLIDANPKYLLVPAALQTTAETLVASTISPTTTADVNPFAGKLEPISDPRLSSATAWYLFADPEFSPALQYSYLDGQENPFVDSREGWRVDGTEYKVRHDFGAGVMDYRLAWKNPGQA